MKGEEYHAGLIRFPLVHDVSMKRYEAIRLVESMGWGTPPRSACYMCPNLADAEWVEMKRDWPEDFEKACQIESELRQDDPHFWLHPSCTPLASVDFDAQLTMFADRGCTGGCFT